MAHNNNPANFARRDKAAEKQKRKPASVVTPVEFEYLAESEDILLLNGPYSGKTLRQIFPEGQEERDYIVKKLWYLNNPQINVVIESMLYQEV